MKDFYAKKKGFYFIFNIILETLKNTIEDSAIRLYENCINVVYDSRGLIYEIPNYCINDPYKFELEFDIRQISRKYFQL